MKKTFTPPVPRHRCIGHRGLAARAPENTLASLKLAAEEGIDWVEFDVQLCLDDHLVLFHDDELSRTSNGSGLVFEHDFKALCLLDAGSWFDEAFKHERIPDLQTALDMLLKYNIYANIELKVPHTPPPGYLKRFVQHFSTALQIHWPSSRPLPLVSSFNWPLLEAVRAQHPTLAIGYLCETPSMEILDHVLAIENAALHCDHQGLTPELLQYARERALPLLVYTVNDPKQAAYLLKEGVFALFSDDPTQLMKEIPSIS